MKSIKRQYGREFIRDTRDYTMTPKTTTRRRRSWRCQWQGDQGQEPSCVGFAWAGWLAASPVSQFADPSGLYELA